MKTKSILIILSIVLLGTTFAFTNTEVQSKDYMTIVVKGKRCSYVYISINGQETERLEMKDESSMSFDYSPVLALLAKYQSEGWTVKNNNLIFYAEKGQGGPINYFYLEK